MLEDATQIPLGPVQADVCIIGAGPAGLTVAAELANAGRDVLVLEAGGPSYDRHDRANLTKVVRDHLSGAQSLARGKGTGEPYYPLRMSRARGLAGSANALLHHGLRARPLDEIDFGPRFGRSWPISYDEFTQCVPPAEVYAGVREAREDPVDWGARPLARHELDSAMVDIAPFRHGDRMGFPRLAARLCNSPRARLVTSAVVVGFQLGNEGMVSSVDVVAGRHSFRVSAGTFVLAAGGIDNARLLLASRALLYRMDRAADHVGRYFMEHLHFVAGYLVPSSPDAAVEIGELFGDPTRPECWLTPSADVVGRDTLRAGFAAVPVYEDSLHPAVPAAGELFRILPYGPFGLRDRLRQAATVLAGARRVIEATARQVSRAQRTIFAVPAMVEQVPHPDSRITLLAGSDRTGLNLPSLHWRVGDKDFVDARRCMDVLAEEVERLGLGTIHSLWDRGAARPTVVTGGWHHMGTTTMSHDPKAGVVDRNCRVHGVANLFIAGSSIFPTSGYVNPTLSLVALAVRLGRYLTEAG